MTDTSFEHTILQDRLRGASHALLWLGIVMTVLGLAAIAWPAVSSLIATLFVGWMLLLFGILALLGAFTIHGTGPFFGALLPALLSIAVGVFLLFNPRAGEVGLTLMVGMIFMLQGAFEMIIAFELRRSASWVPMLVSAILAIFIALVISAQWPEVSLLLLGILVGVNFISTGLGYIAISRALRPIS